LSAASAARSVASAFFVEGPSQGGIREVPLDELGAGMARVTTRFSAVSRGTECTVFQGRVPASEHERMRCPHQAGDFPYPVKYGYASVGRVTAGSDAWVGRSVFCLYPHQTEYVVPESALLPLPEDVPEARAVLAANLETALNAIWDARPLPGDRLTVLGAGVVGALVAYLVRGLPGAEVELVDTNPARSQLARALGVRFCTPEQATRQRDLVFHASGNPAGLETALEIAGQGAEVLELSFYGARSVTLGLGGRFHSQRLAIRSSQVGSVSPNARTRFDHRARLALALSLCRDPLLDVLFGAECDFEDLPAVLPALCDPAHDVLCQRVKYV
jgi:threonine dehydrogenase-like Zn-dependent dehydrogenase